MNPKAQNLLQQGLIDGGFIENGRLSAGLLNADSMRLSLNADLRYRDIFNKSIGNISAIDFVYEVPSQVKNVPGVTCIYFKVLDQPNPELESEIRRLVWNQGRSPTLWIVTSNSIRIYDSFARPTAEIDNESHLLEELLLIGNHVQGISAFHKSLFDSGEFWLSDYGRRIARSERVDKAMLDDLSQTEKLLTSYYSLPLGIAHALLGRAIFVSYLADRGILKPSFFQEKYNCSSFTELLPNKEIVYDFYEWLRNTFNGDLFPVESKEMETVNEDHLRLVELFLSGADLTNYPGTIQQRLWPYKFDVIPIELISSIYEMFAHSRNIEEAEARSIHYTKLQLVDVVLSLAMSDLPHTACILDPACGSGVFLVEAFRRLALMHARELGRILLRDELQEILRRQIFGIDLDKDAVHIAAFSLYLTLLELDPDPQPPEVLRFPRLVSSDAFDEGRAPNLYIQDYCNLSHQFNRNYPFANRKFDLIVGNAPWTALGVDTAPRDPDYPIDGIQWSYDYCKRFNIPDCKPDLAFMLRSRDFASDQTKIALIICSRLLYQQSNIPREKRWLSIFLQFNTIDIFINFSDFVGENVLFGGRSSTRLPASAIFFRRILPSTDGYVTYISPKRHPNLKKQQEITITPGDVHSISQFVLYNEPFLWKSAFHGTPRDYKLLHKLSDLMTLRDVLANVGIQGHDQLSYGLTFGKSDTKDVRELLGTPFLPSGMTIKYGIDINTLPPFDRWAVAEKSNHRKLELPVVILFRSLYKYRARTAVVSPSEQRSYMVFDHMYYGISFARSPMMAYKVNAILNSKLAYYRLFMISSAVGWDRRLVEPVDWFQMPFPNSIFEGSNSIWEVVLSQERWLRENWNLNAKRNLAIQIANAERALDQAIYALYDLSENEITLVEDTMHYTIEPFFKSVTEAYSRPTPNVLEKYATRVCTQLNRLLQYAGLELGATTLSFGHQSPLAACRFSLYPLGTGNKVEHVQLDNVSEMIEELSDDLQSKIADRLYAQKELRIYLGGTFWIIKSAEAKRWSEAAALNDADAVLREHMEANLNVQHG